MRPVNLIPPDQRRGEQAPLRTGALVYLVVGAFVAVLVGVTSVVLIDNKIADRKAEVLRLQREDAIALRKAKELEPYVRFQDFSRQRVETVTSLADSRFDWERVMRELALVLPQDIWFTSLSASVVPGVGPAGGGGGGLRSGVAGPALEIVGCAPSHEAVGGFVTVLKDIDGVTRVGVDSSEVAGKDGGAGTSSGSDDKANEDCRTRSWITKFEIVVGFDAAPIPVTSESEVEVAAAPTESAESAAAGDESEEG